MKKSPHPHDDAHDQLKFENELLNIKLGLEFGMQPCKTSHIDPALENAWLKSIYEFETQFRNAHRITVYEAIGSPSLPLCEALSPDELMLALENVVGLLTQNFIAVDWCCEYPAEVKYKFITEELMKEKFEHIKAGGFVHHFSYEAFHPNHRFDLEEATRFFLQSLFDNSWSNEYDAYLLDSMVMWRSKSYNHKEIESIILAFQADRIFKIHELNFHDVSFNLDSGTGCVDCFLGYQANFHEKEFMFRGDARFTFNRDGVYWRLSSYHIPGF